MLSTPEDNADDSGEEHYEDVDEDAEAKTKEDAKPHKPSYDARKRDPEHAQADLSCLWELLPLQAHYHPSVHVLANRIINQEPIKEKPDPTIYTLMNFLDKFSFRNAKTKSQAVHGTSIMQPMSGTSKAADYLITARDGDRMHDPVNSEQFWRKKVDDVRVDEVFFHTYFEKAGRAKQADKKAKKKNKKADSDDESGEDEIWQALVKSRPDVEGDGGDDEGFSDIDMEDMMSDDEDGGVGMDEGVELNLGSDDDDDDEAGGVEIVDQDEDDDFENFDLDDEDGFMDDDDEVPVDMDMRTATMTRAIRRRRRGSSSIFLHLRLRRTMQSSLAMIASDLVEILGQCIARCRFRRPPSAWLQVSLLNSFTVDIPYFVIAIPAAGGKHAKA
jgi:ribosome biogenesis protein MAK21